MPLLVRPHPPRPDERPAALSSPTAVGSPDPGAAYYHGATGRRTPAPRPCVRAGPGSPWTAAGAADRLRFHIGRGPGRGGGRDRGDAGRLGFSRFSEGPYLLSTERRCGRRRHCRPRISPTCCRCRACTCWPCGCTATRGGAVTASRPSDLLIPLAPAAARDHLAPVHRLVELVPVAQHAVAINRSRVTA